VISSWLLDLTAEALYQTPDLDEYAGHVSDSGEGRWTIQAAVEEGVPVPVLAASLFNRFARAARPTGQPRPLRDAQRLRRHLERVGTVTETADPEQAQQLTTRSPRGLGLRRTPDPCALVIFGASGDLTHKKIMPALYRALRPRAPPSRYRRRLPHRRGRRLLPPGDMEGGEAACARPFRQEVWDRLAPQLHYVAMDFADSGGEDKLHDELGRIDEEKQLGGNSVFYLAVPPPAFPSIVEALGSGATSEADAARRREAVRPRPRVGEAADGDASRVLHRGRDLPDRPLPGQETVRTCSRLLANGIFEPIWNRQFIDHVQITVAESIGIELRAGYYEHAGAIRDIFQNHLLQLLAITAMEPPIDFRSDSVHNEKVKVLRAHTPGPRSVVRGQYGRGSSRARGRRVSRGGGRRAGFDDGDVRRREALRRQLALGRHAVLRAHGQSGSRGTRRRSRSSSSRLPSAVRGDRRGRAALERPHRPRAARRACRWRSARRCRDRA
jgi:hypothetical protein